MLIASRDLSCTIMKYLLVALDLFVIDTYVMVGCMMCSVGKLAVLALTASEISVCL